MTRIIPTVIIHLTGKEQLIKKREEKKKGLEVRGGGGCGGGVKVAVCECMRDGGLVKQSRIRNIATGIPSTRCLRRSLAERAGMTKLKQIERKPGRMLPQSITPGLN